MYLSAEHHVSRHAPYKKLLRDDDDNPIGLLPQSFEMREQDKQALSVNWLEYFESDHEDNIVKMVKAFRLSRDHPVDLASAFGIGNIGRLQEVCAENGHTKVHVEYDKKKNGKKNESHARIIRLPNNDAVIMQLLASEVFTELVLNKDIV